MGIRELHEVMGRHAPWMALAGLRCLLGAASDEVDSEVLNGIADALGDVPSREERRALLTEAAEELEALAGGESWMEP